MQALILVRCSPMPASDLMGKIHLQKRPSILNMYVILGTVRKFGIFFSSKFKKLDSSIHGTQASDQLGSSDAGDPYQYTLHEDLT